MFGPALSGRNDMYNFHTVDVFTSRKFTGNSLAIVEQADDLTDLQMQTLAREFNLPETIFIQRPDSPANTAKVRIFLPLKEIPFAGHPTIGCAIFIAQKIYGAEGDFETEVMLEEQAGLVPVMVERKSGKIRAQLTAPVVPYPVNAPPSEGQLVLDVKNAAAAYGLEEADVLKEPMGPSAHAGGPTFIFIPVASREALSQARACEPLCTTLPQLYGGTGGYLYYIDSDSRVIHARMFAPSGGIPEDPATGSAIALLASQLNVSGLLREGSQTFEIQQGYDMGRPSQIQLEIDVVGACLEAVRVSGTSVPISQGQIVVPDNN